MMTIVSLSLPSLLLWLYLVKCLGNIWHGDRKTIYPINFKLHITLVSNTSLIAFLAQVVWSLDSFMLIVRYYSFFEVHEIDVPDQNYVSYLNVIYVSRGMT